MRVPARLDQIGALTLFQNCHPVQHACEKGGWGLMTHTYDINGSYYRCLGCEVKWSSGAMDRLGIRGRAVRFFVELADPTGEAPQRLVWVTTGRQRHTVLTSDPSLGVPFEEKR